MKPLCPQPPAPLHVWIRSFFALLSFALVILVGSSILHPVWADSSRNSLNWVGMYPGGYSSNTIIAGQSFNIYAQVYKAGATDAMGQASGLSCTLKWSPVDRFGSPWLETTLTPMSYSGDIGSNDEYTAALSPDEGIYEFTVNCSDEATGSLRWQDGGNGHLIVVSTPKDRKAFWVERNTIAWNNVAADTCELIYDRDAQLKIPVKSGSGIPLIRSGQLFRESYPKFPNVSGYTAWKIPDQFFYSQAIAEILKGEVVIAAYDKSGNLIDATGVQLQGVLDDLFSYTGDLGVIYEDGVPTLKVWAPTAKSVELYRFPYADQVTAPIISPMNYEASTGVWSITGDPSWDRQYYQYGVDVYMPSTGQIERNLVTDPYSVNLSRNSRFSQILDLAHDPSLKPEGWDNVIKPPYTVPEDSTIYEVHVRDFSRDDQTVNPDHQGKFKAFTYDGRQDRPGPSDSMNHFIRLAEAGLTHIHLMPAFDFSSVNEDPTTRTDPDYQTLGTLERNSLLPQAIIAVIRGNDSFNWGYDPYHYGVPEGSYATNPDDASRVLEFREMVQALAENGLRTVMGVVYNHTFANDRYTQSVLDKIVPGYYYRYDNDGSLQQSSCCPDTAMEFDMMQKLMIDTLIRWAKDYKVDGFRFDLMNLHTVENMQAAQAALKSLSVEADGVDGQSLYLYGEGWDFGSAKVKGLNHATQFSMAGTGIGTFNDKLRDSVHGGTSVDPVDIRRQGFINGQSYDWNGHFYSSRLRRDLRYTMDRLRVALAGSLQFFTFKDQYDHQVPGIFLGGAGYTLDPQETINYVSKHDNETLYDLNMFKLPLGEFGMAVTPMAERVRAQNLGISLVGLSQGIPFFQLGVDMLRSKSLDRNSYDSGDWFNRIDFTYTRTNFGVGLPPAWDNRSRWPIMNPMLLDSRQNPKPADILASVHHLQEILKIRSSSKLFRLETANDIQDRLHFHNTGSNERDALIVMSLDDRRDSDLDPDHELIVVLFNAHKIPQSFTTPELKGMPLHLHPIQASSHDPIVKSSTFDPEQGEFTIPPRTTAVFVMDQV